MMLHPAIRNLRAAIDCGESLDDDATTAIDEYVAVKGLEEPATRGIAAFQEAFQALLGCLPEPDGAAYTRDNKEAVCKAMLTLFGLGVSQSGTAVKIREGVAEDEAGELLPRTAVLILGFGGASMLELEPVDAIYARLRPAWRTVMGTMTGLQGERADKLREAQMREIAQALVDVEHVFVHAMSNNGFGTWQGLVRSAPPLAAKVRGIVYDCGVVIGGALDEETWHQVVSKTTVGVMVMASCTPGGRGGLGPAMKRIEAASRILAKRIVSSERLLGGETFEEMHAWQQLHEPSVPTLCLTSRGDLVVPEAGVRAYAASLRAAQPTRDVRVVSLQGTHCQLAKSDREQMSRHVESFLARAMYVHMRSAAGAAGLCSHGLKVRERMVAQYEADCRERGEPLPRLGGAEDELEEVVPASPEATAAVAVAAVDVSDPAQTPTTPEALAAAAEGGDAWTALLEKHGLAASVQGALLATPLGMEPQEAMRLLEAEGRPELLAKLKQAGVAVLPVRQKLANAISKEVRLLRGE